MEWLVDLLSTAGGGGLIGLAGSQITKYLELKDKRNDRAHQTKNRELDIEELKLEQQHEKEMADKQVERSKVEGEIQTNIADIGAFTESQKSIGTLTGILKLVRPIITFFLLIAGAVLFGKVWITVGGLSAFSQEELTVLLEFMIHNAVFLIATAVLWWFGSRPGNMK